MRFAVRSAARTADGGVLLGGEGTAGDEKVPAVVELTAAGEFLRMLPVPPMAPRHVAVAPGGRRFVLLTRERWGRDEQRVVLLGPDGWMVRDLGGVPGIERAARLRPDRTSPDYVFVIGERRGRQSAFRLNALAPKRYMELSYAGIPGSRVPEHEAVDVATSADHLVVLGRRGKALIFANAKPVAYAGQLDTELRRPQAVALLPGPAERGARGRSGQAYLCVLPSGRRAAAVHLWRFRLAADGKPVVSKLGAFPDPEHAPEAARLADPVTMDTGCPDRPGLLYVLDGGGSRVRVFDVPAIAARLAAKAPAGVPAAAAIANLPFEGGASDLAVGPGQAVYLVDPEGAAIHTYARRP
jgi:hypothetical protein